MTDDILVTAEGVSKKFCSSLKRSLWYGVQDVASELRGRNGNHAELRKKEFWALDNVSFKLCRGDCLGLIGPNGAGKSTLLKMLNGLIKPDTGKISLHGRVGALIELGAGFNPILTARENIYINGAVLGLSTGEIEEKYQDIVDFAELHEFMETPVQNFSSGMKVRLGFAVASQMQPDVLLIDEVLAVGDARFRSKCYSKISEIRKTSAIIFVSHNSEQLARICNNGIFIDRGKVERIGGIDECLSAYEESLSSHVSSFVDIKKPVRTVEIELSEDEIDFGESLDFSLIIDSKDEIVGSSLRISVFNRLGVIVTDCEIPLKTISFGTTNLKVNLPIVSLKNGDYSLSLNLLDSVGTFLVWAHRASEFKVRNSKFYALSHSVLPNPTCEVNHE